MPLSNFAQAQLLRYYFNGVQPPPLPTIYVGLHKASPGASGDQTTSETAYSGYARLAVAPSSGTFLVSQGSPTRAQNMTPLAFPVCGTLGDTLNFWSVGLAPSGPGPLITFGPIGNGQLYGFSAIGSGGTAVYVPLLPPGMNVGDTVTVSALGPGVLLPGGLVEGAIYYLGAVSGSFLGLAAMPGGPLIQFSTPGSGYLYPVTPLVVAQGGQPTFPANSLLTFQG